ncbi:DsbA family protein [Acetobacter persici]|uniref:DsbA family protein n=1 Tax=Acetobacter persici TaxID=1076596 RepID=UPI00098D1788|nr:DsbA family protein [Acetobacter persici]MBS1015850.1 thioredoxin domain-containing protein [Acetobacter persici]MCG0998308.1 DsbA family protein [Acetobacter persici]
MKKLITFSFRRAALAGAASLLLLCGGAVSAQAADSSFSPAQRAEIVEILRNALRTDPSILSDAISSLQAQASARKASSALETVRRNRAQYGQSTTDVVLGNKSGKLEVVEFYDPRCQYCRKVLGDVDHLLGSEPDLRLVLKVIPVLGPNSVMDAQAIMAAGLQGKYVPFQKALMTDSSAPSAERIHRIAENLGLDADRLQKDMKSPAVTAALSKNVELAKAIDLEGTPTFIIGDREIIPGAASESDLKAALDRLRKATH